MALAFGIGLKEVDEVGVSLASLRRSYCHIGKPRVDGGEEAAGPISLHETRAPSHKAEKRLHPPRRGMGACLIGQNYRALRQSGKKASAYYYYLVFFHHCDGLPNRCRYATSEDTSGDYEMC